MDDIKNLSNEDLAALATEKRTALSALLAKDTPSRDEMTEALGLKKDIDALAAEESDRETAASEFAALQQTFGQDEADEEVEEEAADEPTDEAEESVDEEETDTEDSAEQEEPVAEEEPAVAETPKKQAASLVKKAPRPAVPDTPKSRITLTAAADSGFPAGSKIDLMQLGQAAKNRLRHLPPPNGEGVAQFFPIATIHTEAEEGLLINDSMGQEDIQSVLEYAGDESRLGEALTASAGWCAPSEILYDLCDGEVVDGIWDVPSVTVNRGGFKRTKGIDFNTVYSGVGFQQTEAQAVSGTSKTFYEVPCPTFDEFRMDAIGVGVKVPILLESGYPEQVKDIMRKTMIAHEYKKNASNLTDAIAIAGAARNFTVDLGTLAGDTLSAVSLVATQLRQKYRLGINQTLEIVLPAFAKDAIREDLGMRNGRGAPAVTDAEIDAHFAVRRVRVQWVWGWQEQTTTALAWPTTVNFLAYPAGTFVKGVSSVISLSAVYDAASLAVNLYTGLFMEEGLVLADMCYEAVQGTVPLSLAGNTGAADIT